jgi:large subunit ribosomal protein L30|tara:strand:- start:338 stop:520 length:183 start_codon:yes stop_codon:yes gene_type:complete
MSKEIEITQIKSAIGYNKKTKATLVALGIKKLNTTVVVKNDLSHKGMINKVKHLVQVKEV